MKRLFICGDSFVDWDIPTNHWTDYLKKHYDVRILGERGSDNISIMFQLGNLPEYQKGDRLIMYWSEPSRIQKIFWGKYKPKVKGRWWDYSHLFEKDRIPTLQKMKLDRNAGWEKNGLDNEIKFIKKIKDLLFEYEPLFVTWNTSFYNKAKSFTDLIKVSTLEQESGEGETIGDWHPGERGCYEIYKILLNKLCDDSPLPFENDLI